MNIRLFVLSVLGLTFVSWTLVAVLYVGAKAIMPENATRSGAETTEQRIAMPSAPALPDAPVPDGEATAFEHQGCITSTNDHVSDIPDRVEFRGAQAVSFRPLYEQRVRVESCNVTALDAYDDGCLAVCDEFSSNASAARLRRSAAQDELSKPDPQVGLTEDWVCVDIGAAVSCFRLSHAAAVRAHLRD